METKCKEDIVMALKIIAPDSVDKFLANLKKQDTEDLPSAFVWEETKEGFDYWFELYCSIRALKTEKTSTIVSKTR